MTEAHDTLFPLILDSIREGVFTVDEAFRITSFNAEAERITGFTREAALGKTCYDVLRGSACQDGCPLRRSIETGQPQRNVRVTVLDADMAPIPICVSTAVMRDDAGKLVGGVEIFQDISEIESLRRELADRRGYGDMVGVSHAMQEIFALIPDVAAADVSVLISGASGTGKELLARAIHDASPRQEQPFVRVNCGALPDTLLESELFGYVRGAFTDAHHDKPGRFQQADGGTLFLDEVGELSPAFQVKLLRALQDGEIQPLGSTRAENVDVRVIAATNRDLGALIEAGVFREDLYYRLCVVPVVIPPLAERREDILPLVELYTSRISARTGKDIASVAPQALMALHDYAFPGNVRELVNILERAFVLCHGPEIELEHLPVIVTGPGEVEQPPDAPAPANRLKPSERRLLLRAARASEPATLSRQGRSPIARPEVRQLLDALDAHGWNRAATARALGISRTTLWRRMRDYGLA
jgi:PAS domain S-box-containing protein